MKNLLGGNSKQNYALITTRQLSSNHFDHAFVAGISVDGNAISQRSREYNAVFPLFVEDGMYGDVHNFHTSFVQQIEQNTRLRFSEDIQREDASSFGPLDLFGYVYAVLSSGRYRKIYFEFLRRDFARIPTRVSTQNFRAMASLGLELANLHRDWMSRDPCPWRGGAYCVPNNVSHDSSNARLYLCSDGYFDEVSPGVLDIRVGAFSVVQKWVSDCVKSNSGGCLLAADLIVLGRILQALSQTVKLTSLIDDVLYPSTSSKMPASTRLRSSSETQEMF
jgi:hypothetical protein